MAEHTFEETKKLASLFSTSYNFQNNTNFQWIDDRSYQPGEPYDFKLFDGKQDIGVQLTRAYENEDRDFIRPKHARKVIDLLIKAFDANPLPKVFVSINFENQPKTVKEAEELAYWLEFFIREKVSHSLDFPYYYVYDRSFDEQYLAHITSYISDIRIIKSKRNKNLIFGWSTSKEIPEPLLNDEERVLRAAINKSQKYNELLLIDAFSLPISEFYIPGIKSSLTETPIREVWIVEDFMDAKAYQVK